MSEGAPNDALVIVEHGAYGLPGVARITMNRPAAFNALSEALLDALQRGLDEIAASDARVVVLAGAGRAFCAGHDLKEMLGNPSLEYYQALFARCSAMMLAIQRMPQPVIACVHGMATAAGCQLVAMCDLAVAASDARFAVSGVKLGLFCSTPSVALLRNLSRKVAFEMLVTGDFIDASTALAIGLINQVVPAAGLRQATDTLAHKIAAKSAIALALGKTAFYRQIEMNLADAYAYTSEVMTRNMLAHDAEEGIDAFIAKRKPVWKDE